MQHQKAQDHRRDEIVPHQPGPFIRLRSAAEWKREGDVTKVTRYEFKRVHIENMPSLANTTFEELDFMDSFDEAEAKTSQEGEQ